MALTAGTGTSGGSPTSQAPKIGTAGRKARPNAQTSALGDRVLSGNGSPRIAIDPPAGWSEAAAPRLGSAPRGLCARDGNARQTHRQPLLRPRRAQGTRGPTAVLSWPGARG